MNDIYIMQRMPKNMEKDFHVAIIGAGPAGLYAAESLSDKGYGVALFNRDIKPGGLAEYGIFPDKYKIKNGLRKQFAQILASEKVAYFGNVHVGVGKCIELATLFDWGFDAVLVTCGAQGTKSLHLPGEELKGVMHAKDLVYHYNQLPPYSKQDFYFGKKAAIVGAGNVMADVAHFFIKYTQVEEIVAVIRRGPGEVKFDRKEMENIIAYLDMPAFDAEIKRVSGEMIKVGQDVEVEKAAILAALPKACPKERNVKLRFHFLVSPRQIIPDGKEHVKALECEENLLDLRDGEVAAKGTGQMTMIDVDTVIFAIGDRVLDELGLPMNRNEFCKAKSPLFPINEISYEIEDPATGKNMPGIFIGGWSRNPSTGLVGIARKDGACAAAAIGGYLAQKPSLSGVSELEIEKKLKQAGCQPVTKSHLPLLEAAEKLQAEKLGLEEYKFSTNEDMLRIIGLN
jgi:ferredoxin--NADP+ reductase